MIDSYDSYADLWMTVDTCTISIKADNYEQCAFYIIFNSYTLIIIYIGSPTLSIVCPQGRPLLPSRHYHHHYHAHYHPY